MKYLYERYEERLIEEAKILERFCLSIRNGLTADPETDIRAVAMQSELVSVLANNLLREYREKEPARYAE